MTTHTNTHTQTHTHTHTHTHTQKKKKSSVHTKLIDTDTTQVHPITHDMLSAMDTANSTVL